ncbi:hypothetical protein CcCBS67573_g00125 [Chytriomyces confervae]|uniref:CobW/HypB/UreG nucleotide-binding domain-containing protein n=1 Tax=Chytriomyces confervae TaxID=246404 RepID=A0A507FQA0_9FUNG|nr:hypothetical protein CcCBS67573_g00125 [Chytriomyces confervae]
MAIPVTVLTGFLGAGKTTILMSLLEQIPRGYKVAVLKNEFGDVAVDSQLVQSTKKGAESVKVTEMLNGCLCCVLVGQMKNALLEIRDTYKPDRIIVETSGSAFPAPIAWQIRQIADEGFILDAIVTVIDCVNFTGYEDTSYTAKMQAKYTDLILLNKHELISERQFDLVLDHVYELNEDTPKIKCNGTSGVSPDLIFGIDTKLFQISSANTPIEPNVDGGSTDWMNIDSQHHANEVDLIQIMYPPPSDRVCTEEGDHVCHDHNHSNNHGQTVPEITSDALPFTLFTRDTLDAFLKPLPSDSFYRIKGVLRLQDESSPMILNWAFGRYTLTLLDDPEQSETVQQEAPQVYYRITVMGVDLSMQVNKVVKGFGFSVDANTLKQTGTLKFTAAGRRH